MTESARNQQAKNYPAATRRAQQFLQFNAVSVAYENHEDYRGWEVLLAVFRGRPVGTDRLKFATRSEKSPMWSSRRRSRFLNLQGPSR